VRVLVTGGAGFTGRRVTRLLVEAGYEVRCLVRPGGRTAPLAELPVELVRGDLADAPALRAALSGTDALVNVASIGFGHGPGIVAACEASGVGRAVFFSTTAVFTRLPAPSRSVRLAAEDAIRASGLEWTILRPTMIYGAPGDRNVERLLRLAARHRFLPVVGDGRRRIQPVVVDDLARAAVSALEADRAVRRTYSLPGREPVTFRRFLALAGEAVGKRTVLVPVPVPLALAAASVYEAVVPRPRIRTEQVLRLLEDKDFEWDAAARDLGYDPTDVREGLRREAGLLGLAPGGAS